MKEAIIQILDKWGCHHDWEEYVAVKVNDEWGGYFHYYYYFCKNCGKFKRIKLS